MTDRYIFRGKSLVSGEWVSGLLINKRNWSLKDRAYIKYYPNYKGETDDEGKYVCVDFCTIGQCTGLRDKNGTLIFEGDVVCIMHKHSNEARTGVVKWSDCQWFIAGEYAEYADRLYDMQIIGNKVDNPDLLPQHETEG